MRLCIVQPRLNVTSETFIKSHAENIQCVCGVVHIDREFAAINGKPTLSQSLFQRIIRKADRIRNKRPWEWEKTQSYIDAFRKLDASVVLAEYGPTGVAVLDACNTLKLPLVVHFHGYDASVTDVLQEHKASYARLFNESSAIVTVSRAMTAKLRSLGCPAEKIVLNPYGVDCERFALSHHDYSIGATAPVFLAVGRMVEKKAPHLLIDAFTLVAKSLSDVKLHIIGDGPLMNVCRDLVTTRALENHVTFLGATNHNIVASEMANATAFVQHSVTAANGDSEGTPVAILEASASGLPIIATRHAGIEDVVIHQKSGLLCDERDVEGMFDNMYAVAVKPEMAKSLGEFGSNFVRRNYSMGQVISRLTRLLSAASDRAPLRPIIERIAAELPDPAGFASNSPPN